MPTTKQRSEAVITPVRIVISLCLAAPFVALLWVASYSRTGPTLFGIPFFYWYQLLWVLLSALLTTTAYLLWERDQRARASREDGAA